MGRFKQFMQDQVKKIEEHLENEKRAGKTVNDETIHKWIQEKSKSFKFQWECDHT